MSYEEFLADTAAKLDAVSFSGDVLGDTLRSIPHRSGLWLEFGVWRGRTLRMLADYRGAARVVGFDSFLGLPENWDRPEPHPRGEFALTSDEPFPRVDGADIIVGMFEDTLPAFCAGVARGAITFVHVDCDLYSSTRTVLRNIVPLLAQGATAVFDELIGYDGFERNEMRALYESTVEDGLRFDFIRRGENQAAIAVR